MAGITLSPSLLQTLNGLAEAQGEYASVQGDLDTGQRAPNPDDDAIDYFRAASLAGRATQILNYKGGIDQGVSSVDTALTATTEVEGLLKQLQGVVEGAKGGSPATRTEATRQFLAIGTQLSRLVQDASYQGYNLLNSTAARLTVPLGPRAGGSLQVAGYDLLATGGGTRALFTTAGAFDSRGAILFSNIVADGAGGSSSIRGFSALDTVEASTANQIFDATETRLSDAVTRLHGIAASLGGYSETLQARSTFQQGYAAQLRNAAERLTLTDLNPAAANSQASSLRIALGRQSAALQGRIRSSILQILDAPAAS